MAKFKFTESEWFTPNTYDRNFKYPSDSSGVYLIILRSFPTIFTVKHKIVYVGSSKCLSVRYARHEVLRFLKEIHNDVVFYFKECENYLETEKDLIKLIQPKYNKQWR